MRRRIHLPFFLPLVFVLLTLPGLAAASEIYFRAVGAVQGTIQGESPANHHPSWVETYSFSHGVSVPVGPNGQPSGQPQVTALSLMCKFDRAAVKLMRAQATQENFTSFVMEWVDTSDGQAQTVIRYELANANLVDAFESGSSGGDSRPMLSLSFSYSSITITDLIQGTTATYNWNPISSSTPQPLAKGILLTPTPNPTQGQAEFRFSLPVESNAQLTLFDLRGHRVREVYNGWTSAEPTVAVWDGTDDQGLRVAQGMYVARLTYPGREVTQRITVLR